MNKKLKPLEALEQLCNIALCDCSTNELNRIAHYKYNIETALKQAQEDKKMLDIFKNALTVERDIPPELEIKESEKGCSYIFKEAVKIHENRIEETLKKSLREWVLKNAFPKELKALEIIKEKGVDVSLVIQLAKCHNGYEAYNNHLTSYKGVGDLVNQHRKPLTQEEYDLVKEVLENV